MDPLEKLIIDKIETNDAYRFGISVDTVIKVLGLETANDFAIRAELTRVFKRRGWSKKRRMWADSPPNTYKMGYVPPRHIQFRDTKKENE